MAFPDGPIRTTLPDGTAVILRPIQPEDRRLLEEGLGRLSARSRFTRFFSTLTEFSPRQLDYLTAVDQRKHVAWGAILEGDDLSGVGVGRFARLPDDPDAAEVAVTVLDEHQRRGIGGLLLALLFRTAMHLGVQRLQAYVLRENQDLVTALKALGGTTGVFEDGAIEVSLPIPRSLEDLPQSEEVDKLVAAVRRLEDAIAEAGG